MASENAAALAPIVIKINVPSLKVSKALKINPADTVWSLKKQMIDKLGSDVKDTYNFGIFLHGRDGRQGKFLDEKKDMSGYGIDTTSQIEFVPKARLNSEADIKKQKKFLEDVQKGNIEKAREKGGTKGFEPNFLTETSESPIMTAVMNNDREMILFLVEIGAFLDYRTSDKDGYKTPLHIAAQHNKASALKTLLEFGAWPNAVDINGLTPIYYAATHGHTECVLRLLLAKADTEIFDESGKGPLHQAAMNNFDCIVLQLIDFGADMTAVNVAGNTPLHVAATRNSKESTKWLLIRGSDRNKKNKTGKTPLEAAIIGNCPEAADLITKFQDTQIVLPPPKFQFEGADVSTIVSNVLQSLASSIGGEYKPQPIFLRSQLLGGHGSMRPNSLTPTQKRSTLSSEVGTPEANSNGAVGGDADRRSLMKRKSIAPPPPARTDSREDDADDASSKRGSIINGSSDTRSNHDSMEQSNYSLGPAPLNDFSTSNNHTHMSVEPPSATSSNIVSFRLPSQVSLMESEDTDDAILKPPPVVSSLRQIIASGTDGQIEVDLDTLMSGFNQLESSLSRALEMLKQVKAENNRLKRQTALSSTSTGSRSEA